jgi:hypothetical protein
MCTPTRTAATPTNINDDAPVEAIGWFPIGFKIMVLARPEGEGCIVIRRRPITQSKTFILKPIADEGLPHGHAACRPAMQSVRLPDLTKGSHPVDFPSKK